MKRQFTMPCLLCLKPHGFKLNQLISTVTDMLTPPPPKQVHTDASSHTSAQALSRMHTRTQPHTRLFSYSYDLIANPAVKSHVCLWLSRWHFRLSIRGSAVRSPAPSAHVNVSSRKTLNPELLPAAVLTPYDCKSLWIIVSAKLKVMSCHARCGSRTVNGKHLAVLLFCFPQASCETKTLSPRM